MKKKIYTCFKHQWKIIILVIFLILSYFLYDFSKYVYKWQTLIGSLLTGLIAIGVVFLQRYIDRQNIQRQYRPILTVANCNNLPKNAGFIGISPCIYFNDINESGLSYIRIKNVSNYKALSMKVKVSYKCKEKCVDCDSIESFYIEELDANSEIYITLYKKYMNQFLMSYNDAKSSLISQKAFKKDINDDLERLQEDYKRKFYQLKNKIELNYVKILLTTEQYEQLSFCFYIDYATGQKTHEETLSKNYYLELKDIQNKAYKFSVKPNDVYHNINKK